MINNVSEGYAVSYEIIATMVVIFIILLKLFINQKISVLNTKMTIVSFPSEITVLVMGFLFSDIINDKYGRTTNFISAIMISLILVVIQYAVERWLDNKLSGKLKFSVILTIVVMYIISILFYIIVVFGGIL